VSWNYVDLTIFPTTFGDLDTAGKAIKIALYDKAGGMATVLQSLGATYTTITNFSTLSSYDTLIISSVSVDSIVGSNKTAISNFVTSGKRVIVFNQKLSNWNNTWLDYPIYIVNNSTLTSAGGCAFTTGNDFSNIERESHKIFSGIAWEDFRFWNDNTLVINNDEYIDNRGDSSDCVSLANNYLSRNNSTRYDSILEIFKGSGSYVFCQLDVINKHNVEPVAKRLLTNIIKYSKDFTSNASKLIITSNPYKILVTTSTKLITIEAQDSDGYQDRYCNKTVTLKTTSLGGRFSSNRVTWSSTNESSLTLAYGSGSFYYKDSSSGTPVIIISCVGLSSATQTQTILAPIVNEINSYIIYTPTSTIASGTDTIKVSVILNDTYGNLLANKPVTLIPARGDVTIIKPNSGVTDESGKTITRADISTGCAAVYTFEEPANESYVYDISGNHNDGTLFGTLRTTGKVGTGLQFNGTDYIRVPDSSSLRISNEMTIEAWVKVNEQITYGAVVSKEIYNTPYTGWTLYIGDCWGTNNGKPTLIVRTASGSGNFNLLSNYNIADLTWHHIVATISNAAGKSAIYVDGDKKAEMAINVSDWNCDTPMTIGVRPSFSDTGLLGVIDTSHFFRGMIDEVKIYNRALNIGEIQKSYNITAKVKFYNFFGSPTKIVSTVNPASLVADGISISTIQTSILDINNNIVQTATNTVTFSITGPGTWADGSVGARFITPVGGVTTIVVKSALTVGQIIINANSYGLTGSTVTVPTVHGPANKLDNDVFK
jgi:hypothetical protein